MKVTNNSKVSSRVRVKMFRIYQNESHNVYVRPGEQDARRVASATAAHQESSTHRGDKPACKSLQPGPSGDGDAHSNTPYVQNTPQPWGVEGCLLKHAELWSISHAKYASISNPPGSRVYDSSATADTSKLCPIPLTVECRRELREAELSEENIQTLPLSSHWRYLCISKMWNRRDKQENISISSCFQALHCKPPWGQVGYKHQPF